MTDLPNDQAVLQVLAPIQDPQQGRSLVELNMIRDVVVKPSGVVSFTLALANPNSPQRDALIDRCKTAIKALDGVTDVWAKVIADNPAPAASIALRFQVLNILLPSLVVRVALAKLRCR
jgi:ATP-binding protein involved in chromosome partitioning